MFRRGHSNEIDMGNSGRRGRIPHGGCTREMAVFVLCRDAGSRMRRVRLLGHGKRSLLQDSSRDHLLVLRSSVQSDLSASYA